MKNKELQTTQTDKRQQLTCNPHTKSLVACLESGDKLQLAELTSQLMPEGNPDFKTIRSLTPIKKLCEQPEGRKNTRMILFLMVKAFCESLNVVRNMTEDQMIETAAFLLDECGDMRLEDYQIMFNLAKRGQIGRIMDRVDIYIVSEILEAYWGKRNAFAEKAQDEWYNDDFENIKKNLPTSKEADPELVRKTLRQFANQWQKELEEEKENRKNLSEEEIQRRQKYIANRRKEFES